MYFMKNLQKTNKKSWHSEEDAKLLQYVEEYGVHGAWPLIAEHMENRTGKQCRERFFNHLSPDIKKGAWTKEEDNVIVEQQNKLGNQWTKIAAYLPGRTDNAIKNRWHLINRCKPAEIIVTESNKSSSLNSSLSRSTMAERLVEKLSALNFHTNSNGDMLDILKINFMVVFYNHSEVSHEEYNENDFQICESPSGEITNDMKNFNLKDSKDSNSSDSSKKRKKKNMNISNGNSDPKLYTKNRSRISSKFSPKFAHQQKIKVKRNDTSDMKSPEDDIWMEDLIIAGFNRESSKNSTGSDIDIPVPEALIDKDGDLESLDDLEDIDFNWLEEDTAELSNIHVVSSNSDKINDNDASVNRQGTKHRRQQSAGTPTSKPSQKQRKIFKKEFFPWNREKSSSSSSSSSTIAEKLRNLYKADSTHTVEP